MEEVEVVSIERYVDPSNDSPVYQVTIAKVKKITDEIRERLSPDQINSREVYSNIIQFVIPTKYGNIYPVGSKWNIDINENGISIKKK